MHVFFIFLNVPIFFMFVLMYFTIYVLLLCICLSENSLDELMLCNSTSKLTLYKASCILCQFQFGKHSDMLLLLHKEVSVIITNVETGNLIIAAFIWFIYARPFVFIVLISFVQQSRTMLSACIYYSSQFIFF